MKEAKKSKPELNFREVEISLDVREDGEGKVTELRASVSSEAPYLRRGMWDEENGEYVTGWEVLGHNEDEVDCSRMKDGLVIQDTHWGDQVGIMKIPEIKDGKISGVITFGCGDRSQEIMTDAMNGIRRNMSVGYQVKECKKTGEIREGYPVFRVTKWTPYEASFVNVPADTQVGVGRSMETDEGEAPTVTNERSESNMDKPENPVAAGVSAEEVRGIVKEGIESLRADLAKKPEMPEAKRSVQFDEADAKMIGKRYNVINVIRSMVAAHEGKSFSADIGFEREISDEISKQNHREAKGFFVPDCVLSRAFNVGDTAGTAGKNLVATDKLFGNMIEALVAETVLGKAGVQTLEGLVGNIEIPKAGSATAYWVSSEGGNATESTPDIGQVSGTPHTLGAYTDITRKLLNQSGISAQGFIVDALRSAIARGIEAAAFGGSGSSGQPTGIESTNGINSIENITAGAPTKADLVAFWAALASANVNGNKCFIASPAVKALLAKTLDITTITGASNAVVGGVTAGHYLCEGDKVEGYDIIMSNLCHAKKLYFGDFSQIVLAFWSGIDLTVDTASLSKSGGVRVVALQDMDVLIRHPKAFAVGTMLS